MDLLGRLPHQEQTAGNQNEIAPRETLAEHGENRGCQLDDDGDRAEQCQPEYQSQTDADLPRTLAMLHGQLVGQDGNEDEVVDSQHDLQRHQGEEGRPCSRIDCQSVKIVHATGLLIIVDVECAQSRNRVPCGTLRRPAIAAALGCRLSGRDWLHSGDHIRGGPSACTLSQPRKSASHPKPYPLQATSCEPS